MSAAHSAYLETQILTAAPQKLRLMLIEGCMRFAARAREAKSAGNAEQFSAGLDRARDIVAELLSGIQPDQHPLNDSARALYAFIFKALSEAHLFQDVQKIDDALKVLEEERQTWLQVCELELEMPSSDGRDDFRRQEIVASDFSPSQPAASSRFSLDA